MRPQISLLTLASVLAVSTAFAAPLQPASPLDNIETLRGPVHVRGDGATFTVTLSTPDGSALRRFEIETADRPGRTIAFDAASAEVHFWMGHLVVIAPEQGKALHFSVEGIEELRKPGADGSKLHTASALAELDSLLQDQYQLTRVTTVSSIVSKNEQALKIPAGVQQQVESMGIEYPDPMPGGLGGCGSSCSISCGDGSTCSATCNAPRCASCSCPASCSCS
jgi:hypothetical protein